MTSVYRIRLVSTGIGNLYTRNCILHFVLSSQHCSWTSQLQEQATAILIRWFIDRAYNKRIVDELPSAQQPKSLSFKESIDSPMVGLHSWSLKGLVGYPVLDCRARGIFYDIALLRPRLRSYSPYWTPRIVPFQFVYKHFCKGSQKA